MKQQNRTHLKRIIIIGSILTALTLSMSSCALLFPPRHHNDPHHNDPHQNGPHNNKPHQDNHHNDRPRR